MNLPYHLEATSSRVDFYSVDRLPLQPSGPLLTGRKELRAALRKLQQKPGHRLVASLSSPFSGGGFDVENILFYNVGNSIFRGCTHECLSFSMLQRESSAQQGFDYHHRYEVAPVATMSMQPQLVFQLGSLTPKMKPHDIWWQARNGERQNLPKKLGQFRLSVQLQAPRSSLGLSDIVKPLLDGIISSFHHQPSGIDPLAITRLAGKLGISPDQAGIALSATTGTPLGARRVLSAYRENIKWNPADDLCMECTLARQPSNTGRIHVAVTVAPVR